MSTSSVSTPKQKGDLYLASSLRDGLEDNDLKQLTTLLKNNEADPNVLMPLYGISPFHLVIGNDLEAFAEEVTKLFLRHGGNPNVKSVDGMTPVHIAAAWGRVNILKLLLANGGDPLCLDDDYCSPMHYAFQGEHYEAVSILSQYCIEGDDEDEVPKYKRELDKVIVNNGDLKAEYIVSADSSFDSSDKRSSMLSSEDKFKGNTSGYVPESSSTDTLSINSEFITVRKSQRRRLPKEKTDLSSNDYNKNNFDFTRNTIEEERQILNEIISQLSTTVTSEVDACGVTFNNYEDNCFSSCQTSSPKRRKAINMVFNRPKNSVKNHAAVKKQNNNNNNKRNTTLQVIKQHNSIPRLKNSKLLTNNSLKKPSTISEKDLTAKKIDKTLPAKMTPAAAKLSKSIQENIQQWMNETIISKSPNLAINTQPQSRKSKLIKTPNYEKRVSPLHSKLYKKSPAITSSKSRSGSPSNLNNCITPTSKIPRPKKYFTTPTHLKTGKRAMDTPTGTVIPSKRKSESSRRPSTTEKCKTRTPLNETYSKSENSSPAILTEVRHTQTSRRESYRHIAINLNHRLYDNDEDTTKDKTSPTSVERSKDVGQYVSTFEKELEKLLPKSDFISCYGMLDSGITSKSNSKMESDCNKNKKISTDPLIDIDLNRAILDSLTNSKSKIYGHLDRANNNNRMDKSIDPFDSLMCTRGSILSDSNESFLSASKHDNNPNIANDSNREIDMESSVSPQHSNLISSKNDSPFSCRKLETDSFLSVEEEYKYEDVDEGVVFLERRLCVTPSCGSTDMNSSYYSCSTAQSEPLPREIIMLDKLSLRERLKNLGENPGPITDTTHKLYLKRLHRLESQGVQPKTQVVASRNQTSSVNLDTEVELVKPSLLSIDWIRNLDDYEAIEEKVFLEFATPDPSRKWREGTSKSSFNYLLLDPRITNDLPRRAANLSMTEKWKTFLSAIFYVGKGKKSRPYAHLYDAFKIWVSKDDQNVTNSKIQRILDIWNEGRGVVVLHVFHNTIPVEAYTREAAMIQTIGTQKLGNCKCGDYYGVVATWKTKEKCDLGRYLLFKALQILLLEGERQIFPDNL